VFGLELLIKQKLDHGVASFLFLIKGCLEVVIERVDESISSDYRVNNFLTFKSGNVGFSRLAD
jgi:hypothetical protein